MRLRGAPGVDGRADRPEHHVGEHDGGGPDCGGRFHAGAAQRATAADAHSVAAVLSPDTDTIPHNVDGKYQPRAYEYCAGYQHKDSSIVGFSHTHFSGTGHSDLGDILIMPATGELKLNPGTQPTRMAATVRVSHTIRRYPVPATIE